MPRLPNEPLPPPDLGTNQYADAGQQVIPLGPAADAARIGSNVLRGTRPGDHVNGPLSYELTGVRLRCRLSSGGTLAVSFGVDDVIMSTMDATGAAFAPVGGFYRARALRAGIYLVHWLNEERSAHVVMVIDFPSKSIDLGAKLLGAMELFEQGTIEELKHDETATDAHPSASNDIWAVGAAQGDIVGGPTTDELAGITLGYAYSKAGTFRARYGGDTISFGMPANPLDPPPGMLTVPARMRKLASDLYLVHWFSPDPARTVHCVQVVDFEQMTVFLAALMLPASTEDFDVAKIQLIMGRSTPTS